MNLFLMVECLLLISDNEVILFGGKIYCEQNVIFSFFENDVVQYYYVVKMFMGVYGLFIFGLMEVDLLLIQVEKCLIGQVEEFVVLVDSFKFVCKVGFVLCGLNCVFIVIIDIGVFDSVVQLFEYYGVCVIIVEFEVVDFWVMEVLFLMVFEFVGVFDVGVYCYVGLYF